MSLSASDLTRGAAARARTRLARLGAGAVLSWLCAAACLPLASPARAQATDTGGAIVIPGPGETNPAAAQALAQRLTTGNAPQLTTMNAPQPVPAAPGIVPATRGAGTDDFAHAAAASGAIVIPGPGEPGAQAAGANAYAGNAPVTIPGPAERGPASMPATVNAAPRAEAATAARRVIPVVVASAPNTARAAAQPVAMNPATPAVQPVQAASAARPPAQAQAQALRAQPAAASGVPAGWEDGEAIRQAALAFLQQQAQGLPGNVNITVNQVFPRGLAACASLEPFMPTGSRMWGRTMVGVRCIGDRPWTLYVQAHVSVNATYYIAARALSPGDTLSPADLVARDGDLTTLPQAIITDPSQAVGSISLTRVPQGLPLRRDMLRSVAAVTVGQTVRLVAIGQGFSISSEGSAMNNASPGQPVRVKTASGQVIQGILKDGGTVEVQL
jgi:flagella basal body P-ring formation protein FlgA